VALLWEVSFYGKILSFLMTELAPKFLVEGGWIVDAVILMALFT